MNMKKMIFILICLCFVTGVLVAVSLAAITPIGPYQAEDLSDPNPAPLVYQSSIAHYNDAVIYAGDDGKIYAYDTDSGSSTLVSDTSSLCNQYATVQ